MSERAQSILIPCEVITIRAFVAPEKGPLPLDRLVLEAIGRRPSPPTLQDLVNMFGIGERPMLDLVQNLWSQSLITVNPRHGTMALVPFLRVKLEQDGLGSIGVGTMEEERVTVLRELVSGHILRARRFRGESLGFTIPEAVPPSYGRLSQAEQAELATAVRKMVRPTFARRERVLIQAVPVTSQVSAGAMSMPARSFVQVRARVALDPVSDALRFEVIQPRRIEPRIRLELSRALNNLADANPDLIVFKNIRRRVPADVGADVDAVEASLERLAELCNAATHAPSGSAAAFHRECTAVAAQLQEQIRAANSWPQRVRVLAGERQFHEAVRDAIQTAREQIVLACPFADWDGYERFHEALSGAAQLRGVRIVFVWGIESDDAFLRGTMHLAREAGRGSVLRSTRAAKLHAKFVVRDGDLAVIGSVNFLGRSSTASQVGLVVDSSEPGESSRCAVELLQWARARTPEHAIRGAIEIPSESAIDAHPLRRLPEPPIDAQPTDDAIALWRQGWLQYLRAARDLASRNRDESRLVFDGEHRHLLFRAVNDATWRLLISSDRVTESAFDTRLEQALRGRLQQGLPIALLFRRRSDDGPHGNLAKRLRTLAEDFPASLHLVDVPTHAKILVWDHTSVVTSFNFLSFEGEYEGFRGAKLAREAGVITGNADVTQLVVEALASQHSGTLEAWSASGVQPASAAQAPVGGTSGLLIPTLNELPRLYANLEAVGPARESRQSLIRAFFMRTRQPGEALSQVLTARQLDESDKHHAILCALTRPELEQHPQRSEWLRAVAGRSWKAQQFFAAAVFLHAATCSDGGQRDGLPTGRIARLAAVLDSQDTFTWRLADLGTAPDITSTERNCACGLAVYVLAARGWDGIVDSLEELAQAEATVGAKLARAVHRWWARTMAKLPLDAIEQVILNREAAQERAPIRESLLAALRQGAMPNRFPHFNPGDRTLQIIFGPSGRLQPLYEAAQDDDPTRARDFLQTLGDPDDVVQAAWRVARDRAERLEGHPRETILRLTRAAFNQAQRWTGSVPSGAQNLPTHETDALAALRSELVTLMPELDVSRNDPVLDPIFTPLVSLFAPVLRWTPEGCTDA